MDLFNERLAQLLAMPDDGEGEEENNPGGEFAIGCVEAPEPDLVAAGWDLIDLDHDDELDLNEDATAAMEILKATSRTVRHAVETGVDLERGLLAVKIEASRRALVSAHENRNPVPNLLMSAAMASAAAESPQRPTRRIAYLAMWLLGSLATITLMIFSLTSGIPPSISIPIKMAVLVSAAGLGGLCGLTLTRMATGEVDRTEQQLVVALELARRERDASRGMIMKDRYRRVIRSSTGAERGDAIGLAEQQA